MAIPFSQFISNRNSSPVAERSRIQAVTKLNQQEQDDLQKEREWLESDEYKALQLKLNEMKRTSSVTLDIDTGALSFSRKDPSFLEGLRQFRAFNPVRRTSAPPEVRAERNARHAFETNKERQERAANTFVSIYGIDGKKFDPETDSAQFFFSEQKSDFLSKPEVQKAFIGNPQAAELQFYRQFIKQNNDRAVEEGRDKVFGIPSATSPNINSQINAYKQSILESLTSAKVTNEHLRHNYSQSVTDAAVRDSQISRSFVSPEVAEARLKDPNWVAAQKQTPFQHGALKTDESGRTYLATPPSSSALTPGFTGVGSDFATYMELVEPFGMIGGQVGKSIAKDVFGAGEGVQNLASIAGSVLADPGSLAGLANLASKSPKIATGTKNLLLRNHGKPNSRTAEQLQFTVDNASEVPPSFGLSKTELKEIGFSEEQVVEYARRLAGSESEEPVQPSFLRQNEDGELIFELSPTHNMKVVDVDSYVDVSVQMLGMDDRTGTAIKPMMRALFQGMADSLGTDPDTLVQKIISDVHQLPQNQADGVAGTFLLADTNKFPNAAVLSGILKYSKNTDLRKNGDGFITMMHELAHAIYPTVVAISRNTPSDRANIIDVIKQRTLSRASQSAEGSFTSEQVDFIMNLSADDFQRLVTEARPPDQYLASFNRTHKGYNEELWRQFSESWAEVFAKFLFDTSRQGAGLSRYSDEVDSVLLAATGFLQRNLDEMADRVDRLYPGVAHDADELNAFTGMRGIVGSILEVGRPQVRKSYLTGPRAPAVAIAKYGDETNDALQANVVSGWLLGTDISRFNSVWNRASASGKLITDVAEFQDPNMLRSFRLTQNFSQLLNNPLGEDSAYFALLQKIQSKQGNTGIKPRSMFADEEMTLEARWAIESTLADPKEKAKALWQMPEEVRNTLDYVDEDAIKHVANSGYKDSLGRPQVFFHGGDQWHIYKVGETKGLRDQLYGNGHYGTDSPVAANYLMTGINREVYKYGSESEAIANMGAKRLRAYVISAPQDEILHTASIGDADVVATRWYKTLFSDTGLVKIHEKLHAGDLVKPPSIRTGDLVDLFGREVLDSINEELPAAIHDVLSENVAFHAKVGRLDDADILDDIAERVASTNPRDMDNFVQRVLTTNDYGEDINLAYGTGQDWVPGYAWSNLFAEASVIATYKGLRKYTQTTARVLSEPQQKFLDKVINDHNIISDPAAKLDDNFVEASNLYRHDLNETHNWYLLPYVYDATRALNRNGDLLARGELPPNVLRPEDSSVDVLSWGASPHGTMDHVLRELAINHNAANIIKNLTFDSMLGGLDANLTDIITNFKTYPVTSKTKKIGGYYTYGNLIDDWNDIYTQSNVSVLHTVGGQHVEGIPHIAPILVGTDKKIQSNIHYLATKKPPLEDVGAVRGGQPVSPVDDAPIAYHQRKTGPDDPAVNAADATVEKTQFGNTVEAMYDKFNSGVVKQGKKLVDENRTANPRTVARTSSDEANAEKLNVQANQDKGANFNDGNNNGKNIIPGENNEINWGWTPMAPAALRKVLLAPTDGVLRTSDQITDQGYKEIYDELVPKLNEILNSEEYSTAKKFKQEAKTRFSKQAAAIGYSASKRREAGRYTPGQAYRVSEAAKRKADQVTKAIDEDKGLFKRVDIHPLEAEALIAHGEKVLAEKALEAKAWSASPNLLRQKRKNFLKKGKAAYGAHYSPETGEAQLGIYSAQDFRKAINKLLGLDYETEVKALQAQLNKKDLTVEGIGVHDITGSRRQAFSEVLTNSEAFMLKEAFGIQVTKTDPISLKRALWRLFSGIFNFSRLTMLSGDLSAIGNQGLLLIGDYTKKRGWTNLAHSVLGTVTKGQFDNQMANIYRDPDFAYLSNKTNIYIGDIDGGLTSSEESFMVNIFNSSEEFRTLAKKVPAIKPFLAVGGKLFDGKYSPVKVPAYVIRASQRFHTLYLNKMRYSALKDFNKKLVESGINDAAREQHLKRYADFLNKATGRGSFGKKADQWMPELNAILLAPRWMASRVQVPLAVLGSVGTDAKTAYRMRNLSGETKYTAASIKANKADSSVKLQKHYDFQVTKQIAEDLVRSASIFASATTLLGFAGYKIHTDWRKSNFGQHESGKINADLTAGLGSIYRFIFRSAYAVTTGKSVSASGAEFPAVPGDFLETFIRSKVSPMGAQTYTLMSGTEFTGEEVGTGERFVPGNLNPENYVMLVAQTIQDSAEHLNSATSTTAIGAFAFGGFNISVYPDKEDYALETTGVEYEELYDYEQDYIDVLYSANSKFAPSKYVETRAALATELHDFAETVMANDDFTDSEKNSKIWQYKNKIEAELRGIRKYEYGEYAGTDGDRNALEAKKDEYHELMNEVYSVENPVSDDRRDEMIKSFMDTLTPKERDFIEANRTLLPLPDSIFELQKIRMSPEAKKMYKDANKPLPENLKYGFYSVPAEYMETMEARERLSAEKQRQVTPLSEYAELNREIAGVGSR